MPYPPIEPYNTGTLKVSGLHTVYYEECGNKDGQPVIFLHGGPGGGCQKSDRCYHDPAHYRIVLMDQRGAGRSTPSAELRENTTWDLVADIERLRTHLGIDKWQVFGGSWGSTLSLAYAQTHPDRVTGLILRGIFTLRKSELRFFYQDGASHIHPEAFDEYLAAIPEAEHGDLMQAYHKRLFSDDDETRINAARAWTKWEMMTSRLAVDPKYVARASADDFANAFARIENMYFVNEGWMRDGQLLEKAEIDKIRHIPCVVVQGRYDVVCPATTAYSLKKAWPDIELHMVTDAGHSAEEPGIKALLVDAADRFRRPHEPKPSFSGKSTIVSAPGKVLLAGGYLVLDPEYTGTVIATSSRFYTVVRDAGASGTSAQSSSSKRIRVSSPQFDEAAWDYEVEGEGKTVSVRQTSGNSKNRFVELAIGETLALAGAVKRSKGASDNLGLEDLNIVIVGDNDFYSQRQALSKQNLPANLDSLAKLAPFNRLDTTLSTVHKTGLGSSAALITSLVAALLVHLETIPRSTLAEVTPEQAADPAIKDDLALVHNVAQYVHCLAQGKVGSGFDVSSAVYGGQVYRRFEPKVLEGIMGEAAGKGSDGEALLRVLKPSKDWTNEVQPLALPPGVRLLLADVDAGSDTPSLVGKVLKWREANKEAADEVYESLAGNNNNLSVLLTQLAGLASGRKDSYDATLRVLAGQNLQHPTIQAGLADKGVDGKVVRSVMSLAGTLADIRRDMKRMGEAAGVPIEPDEQTRLLDACVQVEGVIGGGVPGAGGYDAIYLLVLDPSADSSATMDKIQQIWAGYTELSVCPLACAADRGGLRLVERVEDVDGLGKVVGM